MKTLTATLLLATLSFLPIPAKTSQPPAQAAQDADACSPPQIVASFLGFSPAQVTQYETLLSQFLPTVQEACSSKSLYNRPNWTSCSVNPARIRRPS